MSNFIADLICLTLFQIICLSVGNLLLLLLLVIYTFFFAVDWLNSN